MRSRRCQMLFRAPLEVARTKAWRRASRGTSASVRCEPMKPSAPVTRTVRPPETSPKSRRSAASESSVQGESWFGMFIVEGCPRGATESMPATRKSAVRSGVATGLSSLAVAGSAAGAGVLLAHFFGRDERTDGLFVAYGVYLVLSIAAQSFRTVVLPQLTREAVSLGGETVAYLLALAGAGVVVVGTTVALAGPLGRALTAHEVSAHVASRALPWLVAAGFLQLVAALAASALAARDSYEVAALAYSIGAVVALVLFAALHSHGEVSLAWALTAMFVVALRFAAGLGAGKATSLNYAYLIAAVLVVATASSVALISSAPLTRRGIDVEEADAHVPVAVRARAFAGPRRDRGRRPRAERPDRPGRARARRPRRDRRRAGRV